jgi:hypothetical protein
MAEDPENQENRRAPESTPSPLDNAAIAESKAVRTSVYIAAFSAIISIIALIIGLYSARLVSQQNTNAQEQALVSLVTDIVQSQPVLAGTPQSNSLELKALGEGEVANSIITSLPARDVSSIERYLVAEVLEDGQDDQPALKLFVSAAQEASDPRTAADSWREAATILYALDENSEADHDIELSKIAYDVPDVTRSSFEDNLAFSDLFDIQYQVYVNCSRAEDEWNEASKIIQENPSFLDEKFKSLEATDMPDLLQICHILAVTG